MATPTLKTIRAITQALDGRQAAWDNVNLPVPDRVWIVASDTSAVKIGNGTDKYADLPIAFYMNDINAIVTQLPNKAEQNALNNLVERVDTQASQIDDRLIVGITTPDDNTGALGTHYLDTTTKTLYGPKSEDGWGVGTTLASSGSGSTDIGTIEDFITAFDAV